MTKSPRWIKKTIAEADACKTQMPWQRGLRRQAFIAGRLAQEEMRSKITLPAEPVWIMHGTSA